MQTLYTCEHQILEQALTDLLQPAHSEHLHRQGSFPDLTSYLTPFSLPCCSCGDSLTSWLPSPEKAPCREPERLAWASNRFSLF